MAKLARMNTRFQRGAVEIILDLFKGLSRNSRNTSQGQRIGDGGNYIRPV